MPHTSDDSHVMFCYLVVAKPSICDELPYLGGMEVVDEVFSLISRLEQDRQVSSMWCLQRSELQHCSVTRALD